MLRKNCFDRLRNLPRLLPNIRWSNCIRNSITFSGPSHASIPHVCLGLKMHANSVFFSSVQAATYIHKNKSNLRINDFTDVSDLNFL
jgi:hypothetical protein